VSVVVGRSREGCQYGKEQLHGGSDGRAAGGVNEQPESFVTGKKYGEQGQEAERGRTADSQSH